MLCSAEDAPFTLDGDMDIVLCTWKNDDSTEEIYSLQTWYLMRILPERK
jgi:hypothetical protein